MTVLVASASKHGSTGEIARAIAQRLASRGISVDVRTITAVEIPAAEIPAAEAGEAECPTPCPTR